MTPCGSGCGTRQRTNTARGSLLTSSTRNGRCRGSDCRSRHEPAEAVAVSPGSAAATTFLLIAAVVRSLGFGLCSRPGRQRRTTKGDWIMRRSIAPIAAALGTVLALSACTDPYDPGQRAVGGGLLGAGAGAAIGGLAGGGRGAAAGALIGGAVGAVGGAATTPQRPPPPGYYSPPPPPPPGY